MIREILTYPNNKEILTSKSEEVSDINEEIKNLIQDLKDTLKNSKSGCGISAVQIGVLKKVCIIKYNNEYITMINPKITKTRGEVTFREGCLSAPAIYTDVKRAQKVWCSYLDENGNKQEISQGGLCSIIIQHELDHFEGWCEVFNEIKES
ncbi:MAG: peptide deformylase [Bacilli bacterium]